VSATSGRLVLEVPWPEDEQGQSVGLPSLREQADGYCHRPVREQGAPRRLGGCVTAGVMIVAAVAVAFGTGFTASRTLLADGGAWLSNERTVSHVNSGTGRHDATIEEDLVDAPGDQEVVTSTSGTAVVDRGDGTVTTLDTTTMTTEATVSLPEGAVGFVVAGRFGYLVGERVVQPVDPVTLRHEKPAIEVGQVGGAVATAEGTLVVLDIEAGTAIEVVDGVGELPVEVSENPSPDRLALTAVGGRPVVVDTRAGTVRRLRAGGAAEEPIRVEGLAGLAIGDVAVADPHADGSTVWLVRRSDGRLLGVDLDSGHVRSGQLDRRGGSLQAPVVLEGLVYVPSGDSHDVTVVDGTSDQLHQIDRHEPDGSSSRLEVFAHDGRVWINDPAAPQALVVEPDGHHARVVDKGTGRDVDDDPGDEGSPGPGAGAPGAAPQPGPAGDPAGGLPSPSGPSLPGPAPSPAPLVQMDVPQVVGLDRDEACDQIEAAQLVCDDRPVPDAPDDAEQDEVVGQDPSGGRAPVLSPVVVEYYSPDPVEAPELAGQRVTLGGRPEDGPACQAVAEVGLGCAPETVDAVQGQPADEVLPRSQRPDVGTEQEPGEDVTFEYSPTALVPSLTALTPEQACDQVTALNLYCAVEYVTVGATPGQVTGQTPAPGTAVPADSPVARSQVTVQVPQRTSLVPNLVGQDQATACAALAAESLQCSWEVNPTNSIRNPNLVDVQSIAAGTSVQPGTVVSVYHPAGPDANLWRFQAYLDGQPLQQWALAPDAGEGRAVYDELVSRPHRAAVWQRQPQPTVGRCYSTQVEGSVPLYDFMRESDNDRAHQDHFYAGGYSEDPLSQYQRGVGYYGAPFRTLCYVIPRDGAAGAQYVTEWWLGQDGHFYTIGEPAPGSGYTQVGHWMSW
jgi:beta-lactam-binding protein with PASTA domain